MSYKIKTLSSQEIANLLERKGNPLPQRDIRLFLATILPGLFYSVSDKMRDMHDERFLYIPPKLLGPEYSPAVFDTVVYKHFCLEADEIPCDGRSFFPITVEGVPVGGLLCDSEGAGETERRSLLEKFSVSEYFNLIFNINDRLAGGEAIARELLYLVSSQKSYDAFLRSLPEWLIGFMGGGLAAIYYRSGNQYILRKMSGRLSHYEDIPVLLPRDEAERYERALSEKRLFMTVGESPEYATELLVPPLVRFVLGIQSRTETEYLITGIIPNITSYSFALFLDRLGQILSGISEKHFSRQPDWHRLFASLENAMASGRTRQDMTEMILNFLTEYININRVSLVKYCELEDQLEVEGAAHLTRRSELEVGYSFKNKGTSFKVLFETARPVFKANLAASIDDRLEYQLYREGVRSCLLVPIQDENGIIASLNIGSPMIGEYLNQQLPIIETLAAYLSRLFTSSARREAISLYVEQMEELQNKLAAMENMKTMGELASEVFHDLNNIIGGILGRSELILGRLEGTPADVTGSKIIRDIKVIQKSAQDSSEIINRLRQLSKATGERKNDIIDLSETIDDAIEIIRPRWQRLMQERGIRILLQRELSPGVLVSGNAARLREVFTNLLLNSLDALAKGGQISVRCWTARDKAMVTVSDDGTGISDDIREKIFEPFFTTKGEKGTGLGLPLTRKIIDEHGGEISFYSQPGKGTKFTLNLPHRPQPVLAAAGVAFESGRSQRAKVLYIDNNGPAGEISRELNARGYDLREARSGAEAINLCARERFEILIVNANLPDIRGIDLIARIKSFDRLVRVILTESDDGGASVDSLLSQGVDFLLPGDFEPRELLDILECRVANGEAEKIGPES